MEDQIKGLILSVKEPASRRERLPEMALAKAISHFSISHYALLHPILWMDRLWGRSRRKDIEDGR